MRLLTTTLGILFCVLGVSVMVAAQAPTPTADPGVAGKWTLTIDTPIGTQVSALELKVDNRLISGSLARADNQAPNKIAGELTVSGLTFTMTWMGFNGEQSLAFTGTIGADGSMAGTASLDGGDPVNWTAKRVKTTSAP